MFVGGGTAGYLVSHLPKQNFAHITISRNRSQVICSCLCCFVYLAFFKQGVGAPRQTLNVVKFIFGAFSFRASLPPLLCFVASCSSFLTGSYFSRML